MPLFDYFCTNCGVVEEVLLNRTESPPDKCLACDSQNTMVKDVSPPTFILKGPGWAKDGYSKPTNEKT